MRVRSERGVGKGYEFYPAPSPHYFDYTRGLPQLPEDQVGVTMACGSVKMFIVFKYSFYNMHTDQANHERQQDEAEAKVTVQGKKYQRKPFQAKGQHGGSWHYLYSVYDGVEV